MQRLLPASTGAGAHGVRAGRRLPADLVVTPDGPARAPGRLLHRQVRGEQPGVQGVRQRGRLRQTRVLDASVRERRAHGAVGRGHAHARRSDGTAGSAHLVEPEFPDGRADHPVTDVTWYEAAAYAAFRGKQLATIFQWEKAARNGYTPPAGVAAMPWGAFYPGDPLKDRANFGTGTLPTTSAEFGMSAFGAYNMAGNVAEWTSNDSSDGFLATGGAWGDPTYTFSQFGGRPGFFSSEKLGFRCARPATESPGDQGGLRIELDQEVPQYAAPSPPCSRRWRARIAMRRRSWTRGSSRRSRRPSGSASGSRSTARTARARSRTSTCRTTCRGRSRSCTIFRPAMSTADFDRCPTRWTTAWRRSSGAGGRRLRVVLEGYIERLRPAGFVRPAVATVEFAEIIVNRVTDLRRGLDYLETRTDIDMTRIAALLRARAQPSD